MARRPTPKLCALFASRRSRSTSRADGPGYLYAFLDNGQFWKIGMSNNIGRRRRSGIELPVSYSKMASCCCVARRRRAGRKTHREVFTFNGIGRSCWRRLYVRSCLWRTVVRSSTDFD
ncbi:hypothetical protein C8R42DRAFT_649387 [Lentinula raphanica]|nr:hypothetical protein C8R42DRAFT_649387 [Lentinula raphanica]